LSFYSHPPAILQAGSDLFKYGLHQHLPILLNSKDGNFFVLGAHEEAREVSFCSIWFEQGNRRFIFYSCRDQFELAKAGNGRDVIFF